MSCNEPQQYTEADIQVMSAVEAIRRFPWAHLGGHLNQPGILNSLIAESLCLSIHAVCAGTCSAIRVTVTADGTTTVRDNGPGLALDVMEVVFTKVGACRDQKPVNLRSLCSHGVVVVNALSDPFRVRNFRDGSVWVREYRQGEPQGQLLREGDAAETGLEISFRPDPTLFGPLTFDPSALLAWVEGQGTRPVRAEVGPASLRREGLAPVGE